MYKRLLTPGPTQVRPEILKELATPQIHHRSPEFSELYARIQPKLQRVLYTENPVLLFTSSSTGAMEAAVTNLVAKRCLNLVNGAFSGRWHEITVGNGEPCDAFDVVRPLVAGQREQHLDPADAHRRRARHAGVDGDRAGEEEVVAVRPRDAEPLEHVDPGGQIVAPVAVFELLRRVERVRLGQVGHVDDKAAVVARPGLHREVQVDGHRDDAQAEEVLVLAVQADTAGHGNADALAPAVADIVHAWSSVVERRGSLAGGRAGVKNGCNEPIAVRAANTPLD